MPDNINQSTLMARLWRICCESDFIRRQLDFALSYVEAETASVMILDDAGENLVFCFSVGENSDKYTGGGDYQKAVRGPMSATKGINPLVVLYGKPICMEESDPRHNPDIDQLVGTKTHSLYAIPLAVTDRVVGTLSAINAHYKSARGPTEKSFSRQDLEAMNAAAREVHRFISRKWEELVR